jgi:hypothetical protein
MLSTQRSPEIDDAPLPAQEFIEEEEKVGTEIEDNYNKIRSSIK